MPLTRYEQETIINFNKADDIAYIFTYSGRWQRHLDKLGFDPVHTNDFGGKDYEIPKSYIKLPRGPRKLSDTQKDMLRERLRKTACSVGKN